MKSISKCRPAAIIAANSPISYCIYICIRLLLNFNMYLYLSLYVYLCTSAGQLLHATDLFHHGRNDDNIKDSLEWSTLKTLKIVWGGAVGQEA